MYVWHVGCLYSFPIFLKVMRQSKNAIIKLCFPSTEPDSKRRPETVRSHSDDDAQWFLDLINYKTIIKPSKLFFFGDSSGGDSV